MNVNLDEVITLRKAFDSVKKRQKSNPPPDLEERKNRLKKVRESSIGNEDLINRAVETLVKNGIKVRQANSNDDAIRYILEEIKDEKLIVKSKSNVTKEIELTKQLEKRGIKSVETDIGDRVMQLLNSKPSHPTGPIVHLSAKEISKELKKKLNIELGDNPESITQFIIDDINDAFKKTSIGITGANAITAEEGSILLIHNEGNIFRAMRKEKHIIVTSIDKVYPSIEEAINMIKILTFNTTGSLVTSFIEVISGTSKTADIEKKFFPGVHNPKEIVVVLLDNNRNEMVKRGYKELLYCIGCGNCLIYCPIYNVLGNTYAEGNKMGGMGLLVNATKDQGRKDKLELCLTCGKCKINCPVDIDISTEIRKNRSENVFYDAKNYVKSHLIWLYYNFKILKKELTNNDN
jgi:L-lactate dehydrogenase complex protein LldG